VEAKAQGNGMRVVSESEFLERAPALLKSVGSESVLIENADVRSRF